MERSEEEIENLWKLQSEVKQRSESVKSIITELEIERGTLKVRALKLKEDSDVLTTWVEMNYLKLTSMDMGRIEEMFEIESEVEGLAGDDAIEDVLRVLEEAAERGELEIGSYLKQVRVLAREQFFLKHLSSFKTQNFHI
nr:unknown protein [Arabidopsis thaliana]AAS76212.1 At2g38830 [Arabidopsis thaliana]AAS88762.1 At2g38830 [Arabidopsis thaliana]